MRLVSPFEQFEISVVLPLYTDKFDFSITNASIYILFTIGIISLLSFIAIFPQKNLSTSWQAFFESLVKFIANMVVEQAGREAKIQFPFIYTTFCFILTINFLGLVPYGFTLSGHASVTLWFSLSFFFAYIILGFKKFGLTFLKLFLPEGIPTWLIPLLVLIELLSFFIRPLSLAIRLFANMLAGHVLLNIIASACLIAFRLFPLLILFPYTFLIAFMVLEIGIAFLQAYVFTILLTIYLRDSYSIGH